MPKRVYELANELGFDKQELVTKINGLGLGITVSNYMTVLSPAEVETVSHALEKGAAKPQEEEVKVAERVRPTVIKRTRRSRKKADGEEKVAPGVVMRRSRRSAAEEEEEAAEAAAAAAAAAEVEEAEEIEAAPAAAAVEVAAEEEEQAEEIEAAAAEEQEEEAEEIEAAAAPSEEPTQQDEEQEAEEVTAASAEVAEEQEEPAEVETLEAAPAEVAEEAPAQEQEAEEVAAAPAEVAEEQEEPAEVETLEAAPAASAEVAEEAPAAEGEAEADGPKLTTMRSRRGGRMTHIKPREGAKVQGQVDRAVLEQRLQADGKDYSGNGAGPTRTRSNRRTSSRRSSGRSKRRVVSSPNLYDSRSQRNKGNRGKKKRREAPKQTQITEAAEHKRIIRIEDVITVGELARQMGVKAGQLAFKLIEMGVKATVNTTLDYETSALIATEFNYSVENVAFDIGQFYDTSPDSEETLTLRPPVVTVMGHVDHGKTSLLDKIRSANVTEGEAGGITQHIGAYTVGTDHGPITFLDTPGHEAFTALRARGANITDLVILVVAADDGVMPQTVEAINHSKAAGVPIIVAINKIDKPSANPDRVKQALMEYELVAEEYGGQTIFVPVSALQGTNVADLLENVALRAEIEELKANPVRDAQGVIVEAELDTGRGPVATVLVQRGTLKTGDIVVSGRHYGRVRTMTNDRGLPTELAGPSVPVEITGLGGVPEAGEPFFVVPDERDAKRITQHVDEQRRKEQLATRAKPGSLEELGDLIKRGEVKELKVILKSDVQGSNEALQQALAKLGNEEVKVKVIHSAVGGITENDVNLAASAEDQSVVILGFNVRPDSRASEVAEKYNVKVLTYSIIYDAIEQIRQLLEGMLSPIEQEAVVGTAEVRDTFSAPRVGTIAGCYITDGIVRRNARARLFRDGKLIYTSSIGSLRRFKDDVREVKSGFECGLSLENYNDIKVGDVIEVFEINEVAATL